jgi:BolA protein
MNLRLHKIEQKLQHALNPESLDVVDDSHKHAGHAGAKGGAGHFDITIVSDKFEGVDSLSRHRMIYQALDDMMPREIHALMIKALTPDEF